MPATNLDLGMRCIKYLLCAVNFLFVLTGAMIISIGTTIYAVYEDFSTFLDASYFSPAKLLIFVGALIFIIAFCGCVGAMKESTCMVLVFAVSLTIVLVLELSAAVASYTMKDNVVELLNSKINETMYQYPRNAEARGSIDFLQSRLHCCGYKSQNDWKDVLLHSNDSIKVPASCCEWFQESFDLSEPHDQKCVTIHSQGCYYALSLIVDRSTLYIITGAIVIAVIQMGGISLACTLGRAIRKQKTEREKRKWQLRDSLLSDYHPIGKNDPFKAFPIIYMTNDKVQQSKFAA